MRFKIENLGMKIFLIIFLFASLNLNSYFLNPVYAVDSSPSSQIQQKMKALQEEIASKAANLKLEVGKKLLNKAYIGLIKSKSSDSLTLLIDKQTKTVSINDYTEYTGKTKTNFKNLAVNDYVAALGDVDDNEIMTAKKIIRLTPIKEDGKQVIYGVVISKSGSNINIQTKDNKNFNILTDTNTTFIVNKEEVDLSEVLINKPVIIVVTVPKENTFKARSIFSLATPSATPKM